MGGVDEDKSDEGKVKEGMGRAGHHIGECQTNKLFDVTGDVLIGLTQTGRVCWVLICI